jgi:hypothetical protein
MIPDPHRRKTSRYGMAIASVAITDEMSWRLVPREGFVDLPGDPFRRRVIGHA